MFLVSSNVLVLSRLLFYLYVPSSIYSIFRTSVPPGAPVITWNSRPVLGTVGPIMEDQPAELVCTSLGGRPPPSVTWWRDGVKISAREEVGVAGGGVVEVSSKLRVFGARDLARTPLKCQAHIHPRDHIILRPRVAEVLLNVTCELPLIVSVKASQKSSCSPILFCSNSRFLR